ncbi:MAG: hypothetical protein WC402_03140 [Candidatus Pacearchaeota archaeon]|jgi:hypothetical protein
MEEQELRLTVGLCRLDALDLLIDEYAGKGRAKMVQRLLELKHQLVEKLGLNRSLQAQYELQNPTSKGKLLGADSHITNHNKGGLN